MKLAEHSTGVLSEAYRQRAEDLADKDAQRKVGWDIMGKQVEAATMASQVPQAQAQGAQLLAQVQAKGAEAEQAARAKIMATTTHEGRRSSPRRRLARPEKWHRGARKMLLLQPSGRSKQS